MADIFDQQTRSRVMSTIRGSNTKPELIVRRFLHSQGFRYRLHVRGLPGRPDVVLPRYHTVVFVHGCFWHRHRNCRYARLPKSNGRFWLAKLQGNVLRDARSSRALRCAGWRVLTIWECDTNAAALNRLARSIAAGSGSHR
jgi:DNA mismatch endonuclease (patch repair protein)